MEKLYYRLMRLLVSYIRFDQESCRVFWPGLLTKGLEWIKDRQNKTRTNSNDTEYVSLEWFIHYHFSHLWCWYCCCCFCWKWWLAISVIFCCCFLLTAHSQATLQWRWDRGRSLYLSAINLFKWNGPNNLFQIWQNCWRYVYLYWWLIKIQQRQPQQQQQIEKYPSNPNTKKRNK